MNIYYKNPIIPRDMPDPDIIRHEDDFWLVCSSFNSVPGLPIYHSTDLIHWEIVNYAVQVIPDDRYITVNHGEGIWAPSIRFHNNKYWIFYSMPDEGVYVITAEHPTRTWSKPHKLSSQKGWIDPCPFWDSDGRAWLVHAFAFSRAKKKNTIQLIEMSPDASQLISDGEIIIDGSLSYPTLEGPKIYYRNNYYWIFAPAGGVKKGWQVVFRSKSIHGPWESSIVLQQGNSNINGPHQGAFIELANGECWFAHFQDEGIYGRVLHLQPLQWGDTDWPIIGSYNINNGCYEPITSNRYPSLRPNPRQLSYSDTFTANDLSLLWQWQANPDPFWYSCSENGLLLFCINHSNPSIIDSFYTLPNLLLQNFPSKIFTATTTLTTNFSTTGDSAGLIVFGSRYFAICVVLDNSKYYIKGVNGWVDDLKQVHENIFYMKAITSFSEKMEISFQCIMKHDGLFTFSYQISGSDWITIDAILPASAGKWVGAKIGIFSCNFESSSDGCAIFNEFSIT